MALWREDISRAYVKSEDIKLSHQNEKCWLYLFLVLACSCTAESQSFQLGFMSYIEWGSDCCCHSMVETRRIYIIKWPCYSTANDTMQCEKWCYIGSFSSEIDIWTMPRKSTRTFWSFRRTRVWTEVHLTAITVSSVTDSIFCFAIFIIENFNMALQLRYEKNVLLVVTTWFIIIAVWVFIVYL